MQVFIRGLLDFVFWSYSLSLVLNSDFGFTFHFSTMKLKRTGGLFPFCRRQCAPHPSIFEPLFPHPHRQPSELTGGPATRTPGLHCFLSSTCFCLNARVLFPLNAWVLSWVLFPFRPLQSSRPRSGCELRGAGQRELLCLHLEGLGNAGRLKLVCSRKEHFASQSNRLAMASTFKYDLHFSFQMSLCFVCVCVCMPICVHRSKHTIIRPERSVLR